MSDDLTNKRIAVEAIAFTVTGVVAVGIGVSQHGQEVIKIMVNRPIDSISLPPQLISPDIELEYIGDIDAQ